MTSTRFVIFVIILTQFLFVLTSGQIAIAGKTCCLESWDRYVGPIVNFLKNNRNPDPEDLDLTNPEFIKLYKVWNDSFANYYGSAPDDICNGVLVYKCRIQTQTCICNDGQNDGDGLSVLNENGACVVGTKGGFCDDLKFHKCKNGLACMKNPKYGGNFSHCVDPSEEKGPDGSSSNNGNSLSHKNFNGTEFFAIISLLTVWQKIISNSN